MHSRADMQPLPNINDFKPPFFFFTNDRATVIQFVSPSVFDILGYTPEQMVGRRYTDFLVEDHPLNQRISQLHKRRFAGDRSHSVTGVVDAANGHAKVLKIQTYGEVDASSQVIANHGLAQDVTDIYEIPGQFRKQLQLLNQLEARLTDKEKQVLEYVLNGRLNKSIARQLGVSERAIEMTRARLMVKFDAESTAQLIAKAVELRTLRRLIENRLLVA